MPEQLRKVEEREILAAIVESSEDAILSKTLEGIITSWNRGAEKIYGYTADEVIGRSVSMLVPEDHPDEIPQIMSRLQRGETVRHYETVRKRKDGVKIDISLTVSPVRTSDGAIVGASAVARDISLEKRLRIERQFLAMIVESSDDAIYSKSLEGIILSWNKGSEKIYGYSASEIIGKHITILLPHDNRDEFSRIMEHMKKGQRLEHYETLRLRKDGTPIYVSMTISPIYDDTGKIIAASSIAKDVTERKRIETQIQAQLEEKKVLLQEIYHRVKNNLQFVSSLLDLRARHISDVEARSAFKESIERIKAMSLVHEKMYSSERIGTVDFAEYVKALFDPLVQSYSLNRQPVQFLVRSEECLLDLNTAVPLGLILNELLTNSLKHAFTSSQPAKITINIKVCDGRVNLTIADNGIGLPEKFDFASSNTFGFKIVKLLVDQVDGQIEVQQGDGTEFRITLPFSKPQNELALESKYMAL